MPSVPAHCIAKVLTVTAVKKLTYLKDCSVSWFFARYKTTKKLFCKLCQRIPVFLRDTKSPQNL